MAGNGHWETKTYQSGKIGEKVKYFVPASRSRAGVKSGKDKKKSNAGSVTRRAARAINENFKGGDGWLTLTYGPARYQRVLARAERMDPDLSGEDRLWFAAEHELRLCMDRARAALRKRGAELLYLAVTSDTDGDTGELVRVHHHVVASAECVDVILEKWGSEEYEDGEHKNRPDKLWEMDDYTPLAEYMMKQVRYIRNAKKYMPSRNLMRSEPKARRVVSGAVLRVPKGCALLYAAPYTGERECQYIRYLLPEEKWGGVRGAFSDTAWRARTGAPSDCKRRKGAQAREKGGGA